MAGSRRLRWGALAALVLVPAVRSNGPKRGGHGAREALHELSLAQAIWRQVAAEMNKREAGTQLVGVNLVVGALSGTDPESLEFAMRLVVEGSDWPDAEVRIRAESAALRCRDCGRNYEAEGWDWACPACGRTDFEVLAGRDLRLESLEVHEADGWTDSD